MSNAQINSNGSMKSIFIPVEQFFVERHNTFIQMLASRFHVILSSKKKFVFNKNNSNVEYLEEIIKNEKDADEIEESIFFHKEIKKYLYNKAGQIKGAPIRTNKLDSVYKTLEPKIGSAIRTLKLFQKMLKYRHIDFVLVSAEYTYISRPFVVAAKKNKIPVVNIEHGFFSIYDYPEAYRIKPFIQNLFISDYVIVENNLEAEILKCHYKCHSTSTKFLPLGTPLDNSKKELPEKVNAIKSLHLDNERPVLSLFMSWCEPRSIMQVFNQQFDEFEFLDSTFECLSQTELYKYLNLIVKLHPAIHNFKEYSIKDLIYGLAKKHGIKKILITFDELENVIAATDFMLSSSYSSVLWEGFLEGRPIAVKPGAVWLSKMKKSCIPYCNEMCKSDLLCYIIDSSDLEKYIKRYIDFDEIEAYKTRSEKFKKKWKIKNDATATKSERIIQWMYGNNSKLAKVTNASESHYLNENGKSSTNIKQKKSRSYFVDSKGNFFHLNENLRDQLKPGWKTMFQQNNSNPIVPSHQTLANNFKNWQKRVLEMDCFLKKYRIVIQDKDVLEIGTHGGAAAFALSQIGAARVTGTDISSYYIMQTPNGKINKDTIEIEQNKLDAHRNAYTKIIGNKLIKKIDFLEDDICNSKMDPNSYDLIVSWEVIEHLSSPYNAFKHIWRLLKPGGYTFHEYNPFYSIIGGHSLCTLDFLWGHTRISEKDFEAYLEQIRPMEKDVALNFYRHNLNRMSIADLKNYLENIGFHVFAFLSWPEKSHLNLLDADIISQSKRIKPNLQIADLISPIVWMLLKKI